jgi:hypothetical protein
MVDVGDTGPTTTFSAAHENSYEHYVRMFNEGRYSYLLFDGSFISMRYELDGEKIVWHRFCYVPAIVDLDVTAGESVDFLPTRDEYLLTPRKTLLRFEYDPGSQADRHPFSHLHLNSSECRIPVSGALSVKDFLFAIVDMFYPQFLSELAELLKPTQPHVSHLALGDQARMLVKVPL